MKFRIRPRLFTVFSIMPAGILLILAKIFNEDLLFTIAIGVCIFTSIIFRIFYDYFLLEYQSQSFKFAGAKALEKGFNPLNGINFDEDISDLSISEVFEKFNNITEKPLLNTSGYMFTIYKKGTKSNKVEFYEFNTEGVIDFYEYEFDEIGTHDFLEKKQINVENIKKNKRFVALKPR